MIRISVVIPTHNRRKTLESCLGALFTQNYPAKNFEILVCDDGSTDKTVTAVKSLMKVHSNLRYFRQKQSGPAAARNLGITRTKGKIVAFTDDDCQPAKDWLTKIDQALARATRVLGVEGKTVSGKPTADPFTYQLSNEEGGKFWTCNIAYQTTALRKIGGFDEKFRFHNEDIDLAYRIGKAGKIIFDPRVLVIHPQKTMSIFSGLKKLSHLADDFRLWQKHRWYLSQTFPTQNETAVFFLITFGHVIYRLRLLKASLKFFNQNPRVWLKFMVKNLMEIGYILLVFPKAVLFSRMR